MGVKRRLWIKQESNTNTAIDTKSDTAVYTTLTMCEITSVEERIIQTVTSMSSEMEADNWTKMPLSNSDENIAFYIEKILSA